MCMERKKTIVLIRNNGIIAQFSQKNNTLFFFFSQSRKRRQSAAFRYASVHLGNRRVRDSLGFGRPGLENLEFQTFDALVVRVRPQIRAQAKTVIQNDAMLLVESNVVTLTENVCPDGE